MKHALLIAITVFAQAISAAVTVRDDYDHAITLAAPARRIVSLAPHLTEIAYVAGAGPALVGAAEFSDFPPAARALPRVGGSENINVEAILVLRPDLVLAWPSASNLRALDRLAALGLPVFRSEPRTLEGIARTIERLGQLAASAPVADRAAADFRARVTRLGERYGARSKVRVFYEIWDRPLLTVNGEHVISRVIDLCGGENVFSGLPQLVPPVDHEAVLRADPEVIIAGGSAAEQPQWLNAWRGFRGLSAVEHGHLYTIAPDLLQRQTPRLLDGAERLCAMLETVRAGR